MSGVIPYTALTPEPEHPDGLSELEVVPSLFVSPWNEILRSAPAVPLRSTVWPGQS